MDGFGFVSDGPRCFTPVPKLSVTQIYVVSYLSFSSFFIKNANLSFPPYTTLPIFSVTLVSCLFFYLVSVLNLCSSHSLLTHWASKTKKLH